MAIFEWPTRHFPAGPERRLGADNGAIKLAAPLVPKCRPRQQLRAASAKAAGNSNVQSDLVTHVFPGNGLM